MEKELERLSSRIARILIVVCALFAVGNLKAQEFVASYFDNGRNVTYELYDNYTAILVNGKGVNLNNAFSFDFNITYNGEDYTVVGIGDNAFANDKRIAFTKLVIPNTILSIGTSAFNNCTHLEEICLPATLKTIGINVFEGCTALKKIYCQGIEPAILKEDGTLFGETSTTTMKVYTPNNSKELYSTGSSPFSAINIVETTDKSLGVNRIEFSVRDEELTFKPGETQEVHISLIGAKEKFSGAQFDLYLPKGLSIQKDGTGYKASINSSDHILDVNKVSNGSYRFLAYTQKLESSVYQLKKFPIDEDLITITVVADSDYDGGEFKFANCIGSMYSEGTYIEVPSADTSFESSVPEVPITSIALNKSNLTLQVGQSETLTVSYIPTNATGKAITWTSSNPSVATVSATGEITGVAPGTITVTATTKNGQTATCTVTIESAPDIVATSVTISTPQKTNLIIGETLSLSAVVLPETTTNKTVVWSTSNSSVATVDNTGKVTAIGSGDVTITAKCGDASGTITLKVESIITSLSLSSTELTLEKGRKETLKVSYSPSEPDRLSLNWSSSDASIATVNGSGEVTGIKPGTVDITITDTESKLKAECTVTIIETLYGDSNNDGSITINDAVLMVNYILERNPQGFDATRADVDNNGKINIVDVMMTIDLALKASEGSIQRAQALMNTRTPNEAVKLGVTEIDHNDVAVIPVSLETEDMYTALQADFVLPTELEVEDIILDNSLNKTHTVQFIKLENGAIRMILFSSSLQPLSTGNNLLNIHVRKMDDGFTGGEIVMKNAIASMEDGSGMAVSDVKAEISVLSALEDLTVDDTLISVNGKSIIVKTDVGNNVNIFNLAGNKIASYQSAGTRVTEVQGGIYIVIVKGKSYKIWVP